MYPIDFDVKKQRIRWGIGFCVILILFVGNAVNATESEAPIDELLDLSLEELMNVEVDSPATLTKTKARLVPAAVTTITHEDINTCGARSLFELLDIYVPNLQWWRNHWEADNMGLRGILSDRDDKYLMLVNGRVMNERTHYGALTERDLVLLQDIHHIDIVRGPGSALYGPGAVSMVINIVTYNAENFEGTEVTTRLGAVEEFYSAELKHTQPFQDGIGGIFYYFGIGKYNGADAYDAPQVFGFEFPTDSGDATMPQDGWPKGEPLTVLSVNDGETHRNLPPVKFHVELNREDWDIWARYSRGGQQYVWPTGALARSPYGWTGSWILPYEDSSWGYQQATGFVGHTTTISDRSQFNWSLSYDMLDFERFVHSWLQNAHREDKYMGKALFNQELNDQHKIALGAEFLHGEYGIKSPGWPDVGESTGYGRWSTNMYTVFGEHQYTINDQWTTFLGLRMDDHTYTNSLWSPRASLIYTPSKRDTYKLLWAKSVRANYEEELKKYSDPDSQPEKLDSVELRYEHLHNDHLEMAASVYYHDLELLGWSNLASSQIIVGTQKQWGLELEATYRTECSLFAFSHGYTKLIDFELSNPAMISTDPLIQTSAQPYGYGDDLQRWANHITKLTAKHQINDQWSIDSSLRIYWGFPGLKDYAEYYATTQGYQLDWERAYRGSYFLNCGLQYQANDALMIRMDGYNLLGMFDKDLNKRPYGGEGYTDYRSHAAAVALALEYKF